jgi:hypothetical protein
VQHPLGHEHVRAFRRFEDVEGAIGFLDLEPDAAFEHRPPGRRVRVQLACVRGSRRLLDKEGAGVLILDDRLAPGRLGVMPGLHVRQPGDRLHRRLPRRAREWLGVIEDLVSGARRLGGEKSRKEKQRQRR